MCVLIFVVFLHFCKRDTHGKPACGFPFRLESSGTKYSVFEIMSIFYLKWILSYSCGKGADEVILSICTIQGSYFLTQKEQAYFVLP